MKHKTKKNKKYFSDEEERIRVDKTSFHRRERREFSPQNIKRLYSSYSTARLIEEDDLEDEVELTNETEVNSAVKNDSQ